jgi:hypothetical protein
MYKHASLDTLLSSMSITAFYKGLAASAVTVWRREAGVEEGKCIPTVQRGFFSAS